MALHREVGSGDEPCEDWILLEESMKLKPHNGKSEDKWAHSNYGSPFSTIPSGRNTGGAATYNADFDLLSQKSGSKECTSSGVCSGGGCCTPPCQPIVSCNPSSCQSGYSCGHYGCARNKAKSALTRRDGIIVPIDEFVAAANNLSSVAQRNIYGMDRKKHLAVSRKEERKIDAKMYGKLTNPNYLFRQCCEDRHLPDACLWKCHFNTFTKQALQDMFFKTDPCPIEATADLQYCAAQGGDHTACCRRNLIHTTLAGEKCLTFCDQRAGKVIKLDYSYLPCFDRFENMKVCFFTEIKARMEEKLKPRLEESSLPYINFR